MRLVIQRVLHAEVQVDGNTIGKIGKGLLVFVGAGQDDTKEIADKYLRKPFSSSNFSVSVFLKMKMVRPIYH